MLPWVMFFGVSLTVFPVWAQTTLVDAGTAAVNVKQMLNAGRHALQQGDDATAIKIYEEVLRLQPTSGETLYQLAIINFRKKDHVRGFELIHRAVAVTPVENPLPRLALAKALAEIGKGEEAVQEYEKALSSMGPGFQYAEQTSLEMNLLRLRLAAEKRDRDQIKVIGAELMTRHAGNRTMLEIVATIYARAGLFDGAKTAYEQLLEQTPNNPAVAFYLAGVYEMLRQPTMAIKYYEQAIVNADDSGAERTARIKMGLLKAFSYLQESDSENAHVEFQKVLALDENNIIANMNVAGYLHKKKDYGKAKQAYLRVLTAQPDNLDAHYRLAIVYLEVADALNAVRELDLVIARAPASGVGQAAQNTLSKVASRWNIAAVRAVLAEEVTLKEKLQESPEDAATLTAMGGMLMQQKRRDEAIKYFEDAMRADPGYVDAFLNAGLVYEDGRELEKAIKAYQSVLEVVTDAEKKAVLELRLLIASGNFEMKNNEPKKAEENFLQANKVAADDLGVLWGIAASIGQQGDLKRAIEWYLRIVDKYPQYHRARMTVAYVYEQLEEEKKAIAQYRAVSLLQGVPPDLKKSAVARMDYLQRQTNGFSYSVGYSLGFNDNLNSAREQKYFDFSSNLYAGVNYKYKLRKGMKLSVNVTPAYSVYHRAQYDFFNFSVAPSLLFAKWGYDWNAGLTQSTQSSVLRPEQSSTVTQTLTGGASWRSVDQVGYQANMSYRGFGSAGNSFFDADTVTLGINRNHAAPDNAYLSYGYSLTINNSRNVGGNDYAYTGHGVNGRIDKRLNQSLSGYLDSRASLNMYHNGDSATNFQRFRRTLSFGFGGGVNYRVDSWVSVYADYHFSTQYSNLPVGFIFNDLQAIEGRQSASLGSFSKNSINAGVRMNF